MSKKIEMMLQYLNQTLNNLLKDSRSEKFTFINDKTEFKVPLSYALGVSSLITELFLKDPSNLQFDLNISGYEGDFAKFLNGKEVHSNFLWKLGMRLKNSDIINYWKEKTTISMDNIFSRIELEDLDISEEIKYISEHFEDIKDKISRISNNNLIKIMKNKNLIVSDENTIWNLIKTRLSKNDEKNSNIRAELLNCINIKCLN